MTSWLFICDAVNWQVVKEKNIMGLRVSPFSKTLVKRIQPKDFCVIYINRNIGIGGLFEIESLNPIEKVSWIGGRYPYKIKLKPYIIPQVPTSIKPHIKALKMLPNKKNWQICLRRPKKIPDDDIKYLKEKLK